ncbi:putative Succinoglycan biosynthesis transport protein ExoP [Methylocella tundrae]|uniref:non-specific protein-tyrosine kinase n=1 Tax=Methylocella tundrae TaxID=227605 RepID=A0A8B6MBG3_METTU|nr:AAA family ATPase [Methylocella tundrae]VTZ51396.1 putative Succinoglycan biosynthesis transport protein ExoP [Methylocella tundrae]
MDALNSFTTLMRRQWRLIAAACLVGIALGVLVLTLLPKKYTATASVFVDFLHPAGLTTQMAPATLGLVDPAAVESQIDILQSERVAIGAINRLDLFKTPEVLLHPLPIISGIYWLAHEVGLMGSPSDYEIRRAMIAAVMADTTVQRAGKSQGGQETFVIEVSFDARDAELAARMANALAETYLTDQLEARFDMAKLANDWFTERLQTMRKSVSVAEQAAQKYKADNDITMVSGNRAMSLVDEQNLGQIEEGLTSARSALADARSRLATLNQIIALGNPLAAVPDALASPTIQHLRSQYADLTQREADLRQRGTPPEHYVMGQIHAGIAEAQRLIMDEFTRIRNSTQNEVSSTESRIAQLEQQSADSAESLKQIKAKELHAAELDREASAVRTLYEAFMNQFQVTTQAQSYPVSEVRMVTVAQPPVKQSRRVGLILGLGGAVGVLIGGCMAWLRENAGHVKTGQELEDAIGAPFLGALPKVSAQLAPKNRRLGRLRPLLTYAVDNPMSSYAETIRNCKASLAHLKEEPTNAVLGIVSAVQGEGKSTFAANLAYHLASAGHRTLLVDADTRNPDLSSAFDKADSSGLIQVLSQGAAIDDVQIVDPELSLLVFLPCGAQETMADADELLMSPAFVQFVASMRKEFRYVIFDLPPLAPVVDAGIVSRQLDGLYYVARWNKTTGDVIRRALRKSHMAKERLIGGVINCVPEREGERPYSYRRS